MKNKSLLDLFALSLRTGVAAVPLIIAAAQAPANAQAPLTKAQQLAAEAAASRAEADKAGAEADDAAEAADRNAGLTSLGKSSQNSKDIVVTGTSIRGVAPTGSNVITITREDIQATGATSVTELFSTIPQISGIGITSGVTNPSGDSFNNIAQVSPGQVGAAFGSGTNIVRSGLRQNVGDESGTNTLILVDGQRTSNVGSQQLGANQNGVPAALLERVELNTDGASSTYGSNSIGGVINMVTRRRFDGVQVAAKYGYADDYGTWDTSLIAGHTFGSLSVYGAFGYSGNNKLLQGDRSYIKFINWITGLQTGVSCNTPNVQFGTAATGGIRFYPVVNTGTGSISATGFTNTYPTVVTAANGTVISTTGANRCTNTSLATLAPANKNYNGTVSLAYDFGNSVKFTLRGRYGTTKTAGQDEVMNFNRDAGYVITSNNPWYRQSPASETQNANQTVRGTYGPLRGPETRKYISVAAKQWGANAELSWNIDSNWRLLLTGVYDESRSKSFAPNYNTTAINAALDAGTSGNTPANSPCTARTADFVTAGGNTAANAGNAAALTARAAARAVCLNLYDVTQTSQAVQDLIFNWQYRTQGADRILNPKVVVDGSLFDIPGGKIKVAGGAEYREERFTNGFIQGPPPATVVTKDPVTQTVWGIFAEANIPVVSSANALPWLRELRLGISGRYDKYNVGGGTFNPKIGLTIKPTTWVAFRGNWSTNFRAPSALNLLGMQKAGTSAGVTTITNIGTPYNGLRNDGAPEAVPPQTQILVINGTCPCLKPQRSSQWSIAIDLTPARGFKATVSYYFTQYKDNFGSPLGDYTQFPDLVIFQPNITQAAFDEFLSRFGSFSNTTEAAVRSVPLANYWALLDARTANLGKAKVAGLDYSARYTLPVSFGSIFANVSGTFNLMRKSEAVPGDGYSGRPSDPRHRASGQLGMVAGPFRSTLTVAHTDGFRVNPSATSPQTRVSDFNQATLFASYDFPGDAVITKGLQLSLTIQNVLNTSPPLRMGQNGVFGNTLGRVIQVAFQKKF